MPTASLRLSGCRFGFADDLLKRWPAREALQPGRIGGRRPDFCLRELTHCRRGLKQMFPLQISLGWRFARRSPVFRSVATFVCGEWSTPILHDEFAQDSQGVIQVLRSRRGVAAPQIA